MNSIVEARNLSKSFGQHTALDDVNFDVKPGRIVGLIGPNGAGKTTLLRSILGLSTVNGELQVLGMDPRKERSKILEHVSFIADTATLPRWIKVSQVLAYVAGVHPKFQMEKAIAFLETTDIKLKSRVRELSKGMVTQLHLAIVMAIDSKLLVLDEPTLGLDILYRKQFYDTLLNDYFDEERTILVTTHQVEEIANILTDVLFINRGKMVLDESVEHIEESYIELELKTNQMEAFESESYQPIYENRSALGRKLLFKGVPREALEPYGKLRTPSLSDLFVAVMNNKHQGVLS